LFELEKEQSVRTAPKLRHEHIEPPPLYGKMNVKLAAQLNSSKENAILPFQRGITVNSQKTLAFIEEAILWLKSFKILDKKGKIVNNNFRCVNGAVLALTTVRELLFFLHETEGLTYLLTRRLCQDSLESYFSIIRQKNGFNSNPSCFAFSKSYKITQCC
jgi:hypothetical protein